MPPLRLSLACVPNYDRTGPLLEGRTQPEGIEFAPRTAVTRPSELFRRIAQDGEFDVSEMSVSTFLVMLTRGDDRYVGLPIFPSRSFRHGFIFVNAHSGIREPQDLAGKRVGVTEYQQTAAVWIRSFLRDDYGLRAEQMEWVEGGLEGFRPERLAVELPGPVRIGRIGPDQNLDAMLQAGEIDALLGASLPASFRQGVPHVQRLFPDYRAAERAYFERTGYFPIMHLVVVRRPVYEEHPWVARAIYDAFEQAKAQALARLWEVGTLAVSLPWLLPDWEEVQTVFGGDAFPYGLARNRATLEYLLRVSHAEGLSARAIRPEELFVPELQFT
jgi:4,5-dihydroxyphthalate decarboxylase